MTASQGGVPAAVVRPVHRGRACTRCHPTKAAVPPPGGLASCRGVGVGVGVGGGGGGGGGSSGGGGGGCGTNGVTHSWAD